MKFGVEIHAFVLMPNHLHLLITVPEPDLGVVMNEFVSNTTRVHNRLSGRTGHLYGGPYFWSMIRSTRYFCHVVKYVYRNPVKAELCNCVEDYEFSTLYGLLGRSHLPFPIHYTRIGMELALPGSEAWQWLGWLNRPFPAEAESAIRKGLKKKVFDSLINRKTRKPYEVLETLI